MTEQNIRNLVCAIILQATKDYVQGSESAKKSILKDLRSSYMEFISNGTSIIVAEQLELHPKEIAARLRQHHEDEGDLV